MSYYSYNNRGGGFLSSIPTATKNIIIINVLVMIMTSLNGDLMYQKFALFYPTSPFFRWWQPVTHMFMHGGFWHLFFNMYTLYFFGRVLEERWGAKKFLIFYFVTGLGAALIHTGVEWIQMHHWMNQVAEGSMAAQANIHALKITPTVGASGAIYGVLMGFAMLYPDAILTLIFPPVSMKAKWFVLIFGGIELLTGITGVGGGIAHFAHLGGLIFGYLLIMYWKKKRTLYGRDY
ncbi:MAG: rhomboid family intramembrane serine protease [Bacteroidales bacterium]|nr:rhomboid family intramembrane serine protease [Bacteroidales bacterium]MBQ8854710.1 rhomboid family intramembrane serine protease [Bacteroidales bacterium]MBQ9722944.1 rhomboid family intramembrane serine protease [Bacteroidales bacterium]